MASPALYSNYSPLYYLANTPTSQPHALGAEQYQEQLLLRSASPPRSLSSLEQWQTPCSAPMQQFDQFDQFLADQGVSSSSDIRQMDADLQPFAFDYGMPLTSDGTPTSMTAISQLSFWDHFWVPGESWPVDDPLSTGGQQQRDPQSGMPNRPSGTIVPDKDASLGYDRSPPLPFDPSTSLAFVPGKGAIRSDYDLAMQRHDDLLYVSHDTLHASGAGEQALKDRPTSPDIQATIHVPGKPSTVVSSRQYPILKQLYGPP